MKHFLGRPNKSNREKIKWIRLKNREKRGQKAVQFSLCAKIAKKCNLLLLFFNNYEDQSIMKNGTGAINNYPTVYISYPSIWRWKFIESGK